VGELPAKKRIRFAHQYRLDAPTAEIFVANRDLGEYFEKAVSELEEWANNEEGDKSNTEAESRDLARLCANYLATDVLGILQSAPFREDNFPATPENFAEFICLIHKKEISSKIAKQVLAQMAKFGGDPTQIIRDKGLSQISSKGEIGKVVIQVLAENEKAAADWRAGKQNAFQFLIGQVLAATRGRANPDMVKDILLEKLSESKS